MIEDLLQRNRTLESSKRKWKVAALVLASVLLGVLFTIAAVVFPMRQQAMRAAEEARMQEAIARANAEAARQAIEAQKQGKAR
jgi:hypothetical protein